MADLTAVREPKTGLAFASLSDSNLQLLGVGVRVKKIGPIPVKVYAVGLYGDARKLKKDVLAGLVRRGSGRRTLKLVFARDVTGPTIVRAFSSVKTVKTAVKENFKNTMLDLIGSSLKRHDAVSLSCPARAGSIHVLVEKKGQGLGSKTVDGHNLCDSVFDLFLGKASVSPALLDDLQKRSQTTTSNK